MFGTPGIQKRKKIKLAQEKRLVSSDPKRVARVAGMRFDATSGRWVKGNVSIATDGTVSLKGKATRKDAELIETIKSLNLSVF